MSKDERVGHMIAACVGAIESGTDKFTEWECDFIDSIEARHSADYPLSSHQRDTLREVYSKLWEE